MKMCRKTKLARLMVSSLAMLLMLFGCSGGDGAAGPAGAPGAPGAPGLNATQVPVSLASLSPEALETLQMTATVSSITIQSPLTVTFTVKNKANGQPLTGMDGKNAAGTALNNLRFALAKLVPGTNGSPDQWVSYMVTTTSRPTTENTGTLTANADGSYTYVFVKDIKDTTQTGGVTFEPNLTHRLTIQCSGSVSGTTGTIYNPMNVAYDFIPGADGIGKPVAATDTQREIVTIEACNECHGKLAMHGGGRTETKYCVVCHTDQRRIGQTASTSTAGAFAAIVKDATGRVTSASTYIADGEVVGNFAVMVHKIHMGTRLTKNNYNYAQVLFDTIGYPQDPTNCRKCHKGDTPAQLAAAPQANNWKTTPTRLACGACHDNVDFAAGTNHVGGAKADDSFCVLCHDALSIETAHATENATPNNPSVPAGAVNFTYEVSSVTVNASNEPVVTFRILKNGTPVAFNAYAGTTDVDAKNFVASGLLTGFTGSPSFLVAYADGTDTTVDYNNKGKAAAQPPSVSIAELATGASGTLAAGTTAGTYVATLKQAVGSRNSTTGALTPANLVPATFPVGAKMRAVALQGYFTQVYTTDRNGDGSVTTADNLARHTVAAWKGATGDTARRAVVDDEKCAKCHEWFEGHGGNRVKTTLVCVMCHNPNLSSSGTTVALAAAEATQNFKDMIHSIHASKFRTTAYTHNRAKSGVNGFYDWSPTGNHPVHYPGILKNCETCHIAGTYDVELPASALWTTDVTKPAAPVVPADITAARLTLPNATDLVSSPISSTCVACHDGALPVAHIQSNGGALKVLRGSANTEQCVLCHGPGKVADVTVMHNR